jgi:hypothetical protein
VADAIVGLFDDLLPQGHGALVMLKVYLDRGAKADPHDEIVSVGAVVFKPVRYKQFVRPWNRMLRHWEAKAFHATDFYNGAEEFIRNTPERISMYERDSKSIPGMIGSRIAHALHVSFRPKEYLARASDVWKQSFGTSIHSMGVQICLMEMGYWAEERFASEKFAYVMESGDEDEYQILETVTNMRRESDTGKLIRVASFTTADKGQARGTEAADFLAWHWNKYYMDKIRQGLEEFPRKDFAAFIKAGENQVYSIFLTGELLDYFFSRVPQSALRPRDRDK